jgi:transcriptional regulator with XRE-family HTH domain
MTLKAAGAYFTRLRKDARLSRLAFSKEVNTSDSNLMRIEQGNQEAGSILVATIIRKLEANPIDVIDLLLLEDATEQDGIDRAEAWLEVRSGKQQGGNLHPDIVKLASQMSDYELGRWVSMGERLIEENRRAK